MYKVYLTNFGWSIYEGDNPADANQAAVRSGYECVVHGPNGVLTFSPISGWRKCV